MAAFSTVAAVVGAISAVASTVHGITSKPKGGGQLQLPSPNAPAGPPPPTPDQSTFDRPGELPNAPSFLQFSSGMTPLQQRASLATGAVSGENAGFRDEAARNYYRDLVLFDTVGEGGTPKGGSNILPIERQFATEVLGEAPYTDSTESFLSAIMRGT